jgi:hypothetical protein
MTSALMLTGIVHDADRMDRSFDSWSMLHASTARSSPTVTARTSLESGVGGGHAATIGASAIT